MDRILMAVAAAAAMIAAGFSAYSSVVLRAVAEQEFERARQVQAIEAIGEFDKAQGLAPRGLPCLRVLAQLKDPTTVDALHAGASFEVAAAGSLEGLDQCRRRFGASDPAQPVKFSPEDSRAMLRNSVAVLAAFEQLFTGVKSGVASCKTIEARFERTLKEDRAAYMAAIAQFEGQKTALAYPAFSDYLKNGCR